MRAKPLCISRRDFACTRPRELEIKRPAGGAFEARAAAGGLKICQATYLPTYKTDGIHTGSPRPRSCSPYRAPEAKEEAAEESLRAPIPGEPPKASSKVNKTRSRNNLMAPRFRACERPESRNASASVCRARVYGRPAGSARARRMRQRVAPSDLSGHGQADDRY